MKIFKILIGLLIVLLIALVAIGFLLPADARFESSAVVEADAGAVHSKVSTIREWRQWFPLDQVDYSYEGPESGVGATQTWKSEKHGNGQLTIVESDPEKGLRYEISFEPDLEQKHAGGFQYEPAENGTRVTWYFEMDELGVMERYVVVALRSTMESMLDVGLQNLKSYAETGTPPMLDEPAAPDSPAEPDAESSEVESASSSS